MPSGRVLVVDDDAGIQELLALALTSEGYEVLVARDGLDALEKLEGFIPDVIILDLMMPRMDGLAFGEVLRERGLRGRIPILVLSAAAGGHDTVAQLKPEAYVDKPFSLPDFLQKVAQLAA